MAKKHPVVHFEMPYKDSKRVIAFYEKAFGWGMGLGGPEFGNYIVAETTETKEGRPTEPGTINGGFYDQADAAEARYPSVVIAVDDINEGMKSVKQAGGEVLGEPVDIPGIGKYVSFNDTEGNRVSLLQPGM